MRRSVLRRFARSRPRTLAVVLFVTVSTLAQVQTVVDLLPSPGGPAQRVAATEGVAATR